MLQYSIFRTILGRIVGALLVLRMHSNFALSRGRNICAPSDFCEKSESGKLLCLSLIDCVVLSEGINT